MLLPSHTHLLKVEVCLDREVVDLARLGEVMSIRHTSNVAKP